MFELRPSWAEKSGFAQAAFAFARFVVVLAYCGGHGRLAVLEVVEGLFVGRVGVIGKR